MHFSKLIALALATGVTTVAAKDCKVGAQYCGWYLNDNFGYDVPYRQEIWRCLGDGKAEHRITCGMRCVGPTAHCDP